MFIIKRLKERRRKKNINASKSIIRNLFIEYLEIYQKRIGNPEAFVSQDFAQAILDAGFIKIEDVEIDEDKVFDKLINYALSVPPQKLRNVANAIAKTKPLKVRLK